MTHHYRELSGKGKNIAHRKTLSSFFSKYRLYIVKMSFLFSRVFYTTPFFAVGSGLIRLFRVTVNDYY